MQHRFHLTPVSGQEILDQIVNITPLNGKLPLSRLK